MIVRPDGGLTQQGRLLRTFVILAGVSLALVVGSRAVAASPSESGSGSATVQTYAISEGDTVWGIAAAVAGPDESTRSVVDEILALNDMDNASLRVGQVILVRIAP